MKKDSSITFLYKASFLVTILTLFSTLTATTTFAQYTPPQPSPSQTFFVDKKIFNPQTQQFVDNLNRDQYLFIPNQTVDFQLVVTNTGNQDLNNIDITDQLPAELSYVSGGSINKGGQIHFTIDKLSPGQSSQPLLLKAKVNVNAAATGIICPVNLAQAQTGNLMDQDTSTLCIQQNINKQVPPVEQLPKTGLPLVAWSLVGFLPAGLGLRRFARVNKTNTDSPLYTWQKREFNKES